MMDAVQPKMLWVIDLGRCAYRPVWEFQRRLQRMRIDQLIPDVLILVEHPPVYTIGKNGTPDHVIASAQFLAKNGIEVVAVDRGGDVTYHGPGQLVGYPIFDLHQHRKSVSYYMRQLEAVFIDVLKHWQLAGERNEGYTGVWIGEEKILALGVRISRWVTMHGFALNVNPELAHYGGIIPCGIFHKDVTSLSKLLGHPLALADVKPVVVDAFQNVFGFSETEKMDVSGEMVEKMPEAAAESLLSLQNMQEYTDQEKSYES